jgi:hypothetical protein
MQPVLLLRILVDGVLADEEKEKMEKLFASI